MKAGAARTAEELSRKLVRSYPVEAAAILEHLPLDDIVGLVAAQPPESAGPLVERLSTATASEIVGRLDGSHAAAVLTAMGPHRAASLLAGMKKDTQVSLLAQIGASYADELRSLMTYPPESAGALMDTRVLSFSADATAEQALTKLRGAGDRRVSDVYLVDADRRPIGKVRLQDLAIADPARRLGDLAREGFARVNATSSREEVVQELTERKLTSLPVVDFDERLLGVIRHDALVEALRDVSSTDLQTMVGASKEERALSPVSFAVRKRLPWLQINLLTAFLAASVVGIFEDTIARFTALAVLLPVVAGQSGNTGAQALAVTMRGLAMREVRVRQWLRVSYKEVRVAAINGVGVALTTSVGVLVWSRSLGLALVIGVSMVISMIAAGLSGACIPMLLTAVGQDPAQSSSIILTTVTDIVGFFSFLGIATLLAGLL